jgi:hypothetical protein
MYKELEKYKTGKKVPTVYKFLDNSSCVIHEKEYIADLGDLMNDFIEHKTKPFWKRKYYHNHLTELYLQMLNRISIGTSW